MADLADQTLDLLAQFESQRKNIRNREYSETSSPPRTAQGYWQITNDNWNTYAPKVGIDTKQYPNAMSMEEPDQRKVARYLLLNTDSGIKNWLAASNPKFLDEMEKLIPQDSTTDLKVVQPPPKKAPRAESLKGGRSSMADWATSPDPKTTFGIDPSSPGGYVTPGLKQMARGFFGYGSSEGKGFAPRAHEFIQGAEKEMVPAGIGATLGLTGGALATGSGITQSLLPLILGGAGSETLGAMSRSAAPEITKDPDWQNLIGDTGDIAGAYLGGKYGPKLLNSPWGRAGIGALIGHHAGLPPYVGEVLGGLIGGAGEYVPGGPGKFMRGLRGVTVKPEGPVEKPTTLPVTKEADEAIYHKTMSKDEYIAHMKSLGLDDNAAEIKYRTAEARAAKRTSEEAAKVIKEAAKEAEKKKPQGPVITATPEQMRSSTNPKPPTPVILPEGVQLNPAPQGSAPAGPAPSTLIGRQINPVPTAPVNPPNIPPHMRPTGPGVENVIPPSQGGGGPAIPGTAAIGGTNLPQQQFGKVDIPPSAPPPISGTPVNTQIGTMPNLTPAPKGTVARPGIMGTTLTGAAPEVKPGIPGAGTPLGNMPKIVPKSLEGMAAAVADEAESSNSTPPITSNDAVLRGWSKRVGFPVTKDIMAKAREVLTSRGIAKKPRP